MIIHIDYKLQLNIPLLMAMKLWSKLQNPSLFFLFHGMPTLLCQQALPVYRVLLINIETRAAVFNHVQARRGIVSIYLPITQLLYHLLTICWSQLKLFYISNV